MSRWLDSLILVVVLVPFLHFAAAQYPGLDKAANTPPPLTKFAWDISAPIDAGGLSLDELHADNPEAAMLEDSKIPVNPFAGMDIPEPKLNAN